MTIAISALERADAQHLWHPQVRLEAMRRTRPPCIVVRGEIARGRP